MLELIWCREHLPISFYLVFNMGFLNGVLLPAPTSLLQPPPHTFKIPKLSFSKKDKNRKFVLPFFA